MDEPNVVAQGFLLAVAINAIVSAGVWVYTESIDASAVRCD